MCGLAFGILETKNLDERNERTLVLRLFLFIFIIRTVTPAICYTVRVGGRRLVVLPPKLERSSAGTSPYSRLGDVLDEGLQNEQRLKRTHGRVTSPNKIGPRNASATRVFFYTYLFQLFESLLEME